MGGCEVEQEWARRLLTERSRRRLEAKLRGIRIRWASERFCADCGARERHMDLSVRGGVVLCHCCAKKRKT